VTSALLAENGPNSFIWWHWVATHTDDMRERTYQHLQLTVLAIVFGFGLSLVLALLALRWRWLYTPLIWIASVLYSIPSIALFVILLPITGFTTTTVEIALVSYTLLILIRNIVTGVDDVPAAVKEAADGMGYTPLRRFWSIDMRLALPAIMAGLRIATVTTIGLVTVAGIIGAGGYGHFIDEGLSRNFSTEIVVGAVLSIAVAVLFDVALAGVQRLITPWARAEVRR
jgi:osmoprotectant transport system permease protein